MVVVAIAGGTGAFGKTLVEAFEALPQHQVLTLARRKVPEQNDDHPSNLVYVDYEDVEELQKILESNNINTVICAFGINGTSLGVGQRNLIKASQKSTTTKRFIPTSYAIPYPRSGIDILPPLKDHFDCLDDLAASNLVWTIVHNGMFLDYFFPPHAPTNLPSECFIVDMVNKIAAIPGDGETPVSFTYTYDAAKCIARLIDLKTWPAEVRIAGDTLTFNTFIKLIDEITGMKFEVHYDSVEKLKRFEITELPAQRSQAEKFPEGAYQRFMATFALWMTDSTGTIEPNLHEHVGDLDCMTVRQMLEKYWT